MARHQDAAVGDRAVRADQVDRMDLERADGHRHDRPASARGTTARSPWNVSYDAVDAVDDPGLDRRDVERELERAPEPDRAALERRRLGRVNATRRAKLVATSMNIVAAVIVSSSMPVSVDEGLDRRAGLAPAVGQDVELGLELLVALGRVVDAEPDVGEDLAGLVVHGAGGARCGCSCPRGR